MVCNEWVWTTLRNNRRRSGGKTYSEICMCNWRKLSRKRCGNDQGLVCRGGPYIWGGRWYMGGGGGLSYGGGAVRLGGEL